METAHRVADAAAWMALSERDREFVRQKRAMRASWDAIARMLEVPTDTVRRSCDPAYRVAHSPAPPVAAISPQEGLRRRLQADGLPPHLVKMLGIIAAAGKPVPIDVLLQDRLPVMAGKDRRDAAATAFRREAAEAGYAIAVSTQGYAFTPTAREAIAARLANRVR